MKSFKCNKGEKCYRDFVLLFFTLILFLCNNTYTFSADKKMNDDSKFLKSNKFPLIRLSAYRNGTPWLTDETVVYFDSLATTGFDSELDAYKIMNDAAGVPNIYSVMFHNLRLSINALPIRWDTIVVVPLGLEVDACADYSITATVIQNFPSNIQIYLLDSVNGVIQNLNNNPTYTFSCNTGFTESRLSLRLASERVIITWSYQLPAKNLTNVFANSDELNINNINNPKDIHFTVFNTEGQIVLESAISSYENKRFVLNRGIYIVRIDSEDKAFKKKIIIE